LLRRLPFHLSKQAFLRGLQAPPLIRVAISLEFSIAYAHLKTQPSLVGIIGGAIHGGQGSLREREQWDISVALGEARKDWRKAQAILTQPHTW